MDEEGRLTIRLSVGDRVRWELAAGPGVPLSRFVKMVVERHLARDGGVAAPLSGEPFDGNCRNREYHQDGRLCRFCNGTREEQR